MDEQIIEAMRQGVLWPLAKLTFITLGGLLVIRAVMLFLLPDKKRGVSAI